MASIHLSDESEHEPQRAAWKSQPPATSDAGEAAFGQETAQGVPVQEVSPSGTVIVRGAEQDLWHAVRPLLVSWHRRAREAQYSHYLAEEQYGRINQRLIFWAQVLSASAGFSGLTHFLKGFGDIGAIITLVLGLLAAVLVTLQSKLKYGEMADKHKATGARWGALRRRIEVMARLEQGNAQEAIEALQKEYDEQSEQAPAVSIELWRNAVERAGNDYTPLYPSAEDRISLDNQP